MRSNENFSYDKPSQYRQSYQATAAKSPERRRVDQTQDYTPTKFSRKPSDRVSQLKNSINKCIESLSNKKQMNRQALEQVKMVNREVNQHLSNQGSNKMYRSNQKPFQNYEQPYNRTDYAPRHDQRSQKERQNITLSSFHLAPTLQHPTRISQFQNSQVYRPQSLSSNHYQIQQLKQRIRSQRLQNQNLQRQVQLLERDHQQLLSSTSNFGVQQDPYLLQQNLRLRDQLQRVSSGGSMNMLYEQFKQLKQDNKKLRSETINLLKNVRY